MIFENSFSSSSLKGKLENLFILFFSEMLITDFSVRTVKMENLICLDTPTPKLEKKKVCYNRIEVYFIPQKPFHRSNMISHPVNVS